MPELDYILDKIIDETAPIGCSTCLFMATHEKCGKCLYKTYGPHPGEVFEYNNWTPGNYLRHLHAAEISGRYNIVIGGQGEAEFCSTNSPDSVARHLRRVAMECGYLVGRLLSGKSGTTLTISTRDGEFTITWVDNILSSIIPSTQSNWRWDKNYSNC